MAQWIKTGQKHGLTANTVYEMQIPSDRWGNPISGSYWLDIAKGKIPGSSVVFLSGYNSDVDTATVPETIWNSNGAYPWSAWVGGPYTLYAVSDNVLDNSGVQVLLSGLDGNYALQTEVITMNGTTAVSTTKTFMRLNSAVVVSSQSAAGNISITVGSAGGTRVGLIEDGAGSTAMSVYTVPAGYTAFSVFGDFSVNKGEAARLAARWRFYGGSFITVYTIEVADNAYTAAPLIPGAIPEKTDIDNQVWLVTNNNVRVYSNQQLLLVNNNYL